MSDHVAVARDPFARETLVRRTADRSDVAGTDRVECAWCGQRSRFQYGVERDSLNGRTSWDRMTFCGISCRRTYHR